MDAPLIIEAADGVLVLTLNRPASRNALSLALVRDLRAALDDYRSDTALRCAVITGADPAFCAGLDLKDFSAPDAPRGEVGDLIRSLPDLGKPLIAAVNGPAMTGGLELALGCDFILASERARFGDTHNRIGALSGSGMGSRLPHAVGTRFAKQMVLSCEPIDAATALRVGLVNEVVAHDALATRARAVAAMIAAHDPELVKLSKAVLDRGAVATLAEALTIERDVLAERKARGAMTWTSKRE
jgi:enoyl-CoA hydratase